jgi:hypothetical protein
MDHFIDVLENKQPHPSNVIKAASTGEPLAIIDNPVYSDAKKHDSLIGVQVATKLHLLQ